MSRHIIRCVIGVLAGLAAWAGQAAESSIPVYDYRVVHAFPHDPQAFTQGLLYRDGFLYESTGLNGRSTIRKVSLETGKVLQKSDLPAEYFGEGLAAWGDELYGVTWQSQVGFVFDLKTLALKRRFSYTGEGWGLTHDDKQIILSDGSSVLRWMDPQTMQVVRKVQVTADGQPVDQINELEMVGGELLANLWQTDVIARIDPASGHVVGWIDLSGLLPAAARSAGPVDVLNGIAYDPDKKRLFVTGKLWPQLFEITLLPRMRRKSPS